MKNHIIKTAIMAPIGMAVTVYLNDCKNHLSRVNGVLVAIEEDKAIIKTPQKKTVKVCIDKITMIHSRKIRLNINSIKV